VIDRNGDLPYYRQLINFVQSQIDAGVLKEGEQLPSEVALAEAYHVNRHTVRQAFSELCRIGVLYREKGCGTFVAKPLLDCMEYKLSRKNRFTENICQAGGVPGSQVLRAMEMNAPAEVARKLSLGKAENVYVLELLRTVNGNPFLASTNFFPVRLFPEFLGKLMDFISLSDLLDEHYGIQLHRSSCLFRASFPNAQEAAALNVPRNLPVLRVENVLKSQDEVLSQYSVTCYRGDNAKVSVEWEKN